MLVNQLAQVIHQPRYPLFSLFDDVLLLGPGGRTVLWPCLRGAEHATGKKW